MSNHPKTFEKRGNCYVGISTAVSYQFGEIIIMAPNMETLKTAFEAFTGGSILDGSISKECALIDATRVYKSGRIKP